MRVVSMHLQNMKVVFTIKSNVKRRQNVTQRCTEVTKSIYNLQIRIHGEYNQSTNKHDPAWDVK